VKEGWPTICMACDYGIVSRGVFQYTVIYGVGKKVKEGWPTICMACDYGIVSRESSSTLSSTV